MQNSGNAHIYAASLPDFAFFISPLHVKRKRFWNWAITPRLAITSYFLTRHTKICKKNLGVAWKDFKFVVIRHWQTSILLTRCSVLALSDIFSCSNVRFVSFVNFSSLKTQISRFSHFTGSGSQEWRPEDDRNDGGHFSFLRLANQAKPIEPEAS